MAKKIQKGKITTKMNILCFFLLVDWTLLIVVKRTKINLFCDYWLNAASYQC